MLVQFICSVSSIFPSDSHSLYFQCNSYNSCSRSLLSGCHSTRPQAPPRPLALLLLHLPLLGPRSSRSRRPSPRPIRCLAVLSPSPRPRGTTMSTRGPRIAACTGMADCRESMGRSSHSSRARRLTTYSNACGNSESTSRTECSLTLIGRSTSRTIDFPGALASNYSYKQTNI